MWSAEGADKTIYIAAHFYFLLLASACWVEISWIWHHILDRDTIGELSMYELWRTQRTFVQPRLNRANILRRNVDEEGRGGRGFEVWGVLLVVLLLAAGSNDKIRGGAISSGLLEEKGQFIIGSSSLGAVAYFTLSNLNHHMHNVHGHTSTDTDTNTH